MHVNSPSKISAVFIRVGFSHPWRVRQSASCEAFGQQALKICGSLYCKQKQLHFDFLRPCPHDFGELCPEEHTTQMESMCEHHFLSLAQRRVLERLFKFSFLCTPLSQKNNFKNFNYIKRKTIEVI